LFDVFVSYRHLDGDAVGRLVGALEKRGLRVWFDRTSISDFGGITDAARRGLAESKALLVYYSAIYDRSAPCQWELTLAFLAAAKLGDPRRRILVVNPEPGVARIGPVELRDALHVSLSEEHDDSAVAAVADEVAHHVADLEGDLSSAITVPALWLPFQPTAASRFVGRRREMWRVHSALHVADAAMTQSGVGPGAALVRGLGGVGKSLLAREYALRFDGAYPGGVF